MLNWTDSHSQERICRSPSFLRGDSSMSLEEKKCSPHQRYTAWGWFIWLQWFLPQGKRRTVSEWLASPVLWDAAGETHFSPRARKVLRWDCGGGRILGKRQIRISKGIKGSSAASPPMSLWEYHTQGSLFWILRSPTCRVLNPHLLPLWGQFLFVPPCVVHDRELQKTREHNRKQAPVYGQGRKHKLEV